MSDRKNAIIKPDDHKQVTGYQGAEQTAEARRAIVSNVVAAHRELFRHRHPEKLSLYDHESLSNSIDEYLSFCAHHALLPNMSGFAGFVGLNRCWIYEYMDRNPNEESTRILRRFRSLMDSARITATDQKAAAESLSIFLLKNSHSGYSDRMEIQPVPNASPLDSLTASEKMKRYLESIPDDE